MQCTNYKIKGNHRSYRCKVMRQDAWIYDPWGKKLPGGPVCLACATDMIKEYREKLGELWSYVLLTKEELKHSR